MSSADVAIAYVLVPDLCQLKLSVYLVASIMPNGLFQKMLPCNDNKCFLVLQKIIHS